jgi:hypothetical protein
LSLLSRRAAALAAAGVVLALVAACSAFAWPEGSPLVPDPERGADRAWAWAFLGCELAAFGAYLAALWMLRGRSGTVAAIVAAAVAIQLVPLAAPLLLSTDAWTYWDYGRIAAVHGGNPYGATPGDFPSDPAYRYTGSAWRNTASVYGPAFTLASEPVALAVGSSAAAAAWIFKGLGAAAVLAAAVLASRLSRERAFAAAFVGWNPLLALHFAGGGHNDAWMIALVVAALSLAAVGRRQAAGAAWAAAVLVKWIPLAFLPLRALEARAHERRVGHAGFAAVALVVVAVASWQFGWRWLGAFGSLAGNANRQTSYALVSRLEEAGLVREAAVAVVAAIGLLGYAWLLVQARRGRARLGVAAALLLVATPYLAAWYTAWLVPLAAAEEDRAAQVAALVLCAYLLPQSVPV